MKMRLKILAVAACLAMVAVACGGGDDSPAESSPASTPAPAPTQEPAIESAPEGAAPAPASDLPSVDLVNVDTGATVNLASFAPSDRPLVLWFWAPH